MKISSSCIKRDNNQLLLFMYSTFHSWFHQLHQPLRQMSRGTTHHSPTPHQKKVIKMPTRNKPTKIHCQCLYQWLIGSKLLFFHWSSYYWSLVIFDISVCLVWQLHCRTFTSSKNKTKNCNNKIKIPLSGRCQHHKPIPVHKTAIRYTVSKCSKKSGLNNMFKQQLEMQFTTIQGTLLLKHFPLQM